MKLPPAPKWNKITDDIDSVDYLRRAQHYERSLLPPDIAFPRAGQVWEAVRDCEVWFRVLFSITATPNVWLPKAAAAVCLPTPMSKEFLVPGGKARLQQGERVRIRSVDDASKPLHVTFVPLRYDELYESIVPADHRRSSSHYVLTLRTAYTPCCSREERAFFTELFRLVEDSQ